MINYFSLKFNNLIIAFLSFFISLVAYIFTLAPSIVMEDSGELITASATLGIAHPSGYPLYTILGKLFTLLPFGSIAWKVNLMSAFFGALSVAMLYLLINKLFKDKIIAFALSLLLGFSPIFWSQSVVAEVYTLNLFFVISLLYILLLWQESGQDKYIYVFSFLFGLSLTNHTMNIVLAPAYIIFILLVNKRIILNWQLILKMFLLSLVGLSVYFYIPIRGFQMPDFNWGPITTWHDVWTHISRAQYSDFKIFDANAGRGIIVLSFILELYNQFFLPSLILAFGGLVYFFRTSSKFAFLTLAVFILNSFGLIYLRQFGWGVGIDHIYRVYYLPAIMVVVIWLAIALKYLIDFLTANLYVKSPLLGRFSVVLLYLTILLLPLSFFVSSYQNNDMSDFWVNYDYSKNLLLSMEPNSVYYYAYDGGINGDTELFSLVYLKMIEGVRPDVDVISTHNLFYKDYYINLPKEFYDLEFKDRNKELLRLMSEVMADRPLYTNFAVTEKNNDLGLFSVSNGLIHKVFPDFETARNAQVASADFMIRGIDDLNERDYAQAGFAAHYYYNLAAFYLVNDQFSKAQDYLIEATRFDNIVLSHEYSNFLDYRSQLMSEYK